jgi:UDPglucose 6-dehydrogenase
LRQHGCRVLVHDYQAKPAVSPSLIEFENLDTPAALSQYKDLKVVVICCPWPEYSEVAIPHHAKLVDPWGLRRQKTS